MITLFVIGACRRESKRCRPNLLPIIHAYGANWEHLGEKGVLPGLVEVYTENWGSGLSKQSCRSYYMLPSQLAKQDKKVTSALFIDVKGAFNHVSAHQLIKICIELGLPESLCSWIDFFLVDRKIQLAFDNGKSIEIDI